MKLTFLGTSHGIPEKNRFCSSTLVTTANGNNYVIDAGAPVCTLLKNYDIDIGNGINGFFITHPHSDHYIGLAEYCEVITDYRCYKGCKPKIYIPSYKFIPTIYRLNYLFGKGGKIKFKHFSKGVIFDDGTAKITAIKVKHIHRSYAFLFEADGKSVLFSGDLKYNMPDYPEILFKKKTDILILEGAHTLLTQPFIVDKIKKSLCDKLIINHYSKRNDEKIRQKLFKALDGNKVCFTAVDGMQIEV